MHNIQQHLTLDVDKVNYIGETSDVIVVLPVNRFIEEVNVLFDYETRKGHVTSTTYERCVKRVSQVQYWLDTIYCTLRYVPTYPDLKRPIRIEVLTRNLLDSAFLEHEGYVAQILVLDSEYAILRRTGTNYHEVVFHDRLNSSEVQRIERFLLSMHTFRGIETNLHVNFTLSHDTVIERFNDRYILVEQ